MSRIAVCVGGMTTAERDRIKELERENRQLRQANEILKKGEAFVRHWSEDNELVSNLVSKRSLCGGLILV